jgi:hypothetical protein
MVLGRIIRSIHAEHLSPIRPRLLTKLFVLGDFIALTIQGNASGLTAKASTQKAGEAIITAGLFIQIALFGLFCFVAFIFHKRMLQRGGKEAEQHPHVPWKQGLWVLYICSALIMFRSIFRVVEYIMGVDGYLLATEWPMYAMDAAPMIIVQIIFLIWFPAAFRIPPPATPSSETGYALMDASTDGKTPNTNKEEDKKSSMFSWVPGLRR